MGLTRKAVLRHYNTIKREYFKAFKECIKYSNYEARIFLKNNGMPVIKWYAQGENLKCADEYDMYYLCTIDLTYFDYGEGDKYKDGRPKVCKIMRECARDIERELKARIDTLVSRYCE